jgi:hypothetical protein
MEIDSIIFSLYLDPRFISKNVNDGRLTKLITSLLPKHIQNLAIFDKTNSQSTAHNEICKKLDSLL